MPLCGAAYTATKGAVNNLTRNIAIRFFGTRIRCNAVAPGYADTDMARGYPAGELPGGASRILPFGRMYSNLDLPSTQPEDQANAILYFASDLSRVDGG